LESTWASIPVECFPCPQQIESVLRAKGGTIQY
jgi:hypothetical protein